MNISLFEEINKYTPKKRKSFVEKYEPRKKRSIFDQETSGSTWKTVFLIIIVFVVFFVFIGRAISVQIVNRSAYLTLAERNRIREFSIFSSRGLIYDRSGKTIVRNKPSFSIELNSLICKDPEVVRSCSDLIQDVKNYIALDDEDRVTKELKEGRSNIILATGVSKDTVLLIESHIQNMPGISIETAPTRDYLYADAFSHLIGYIGLGETLSPTIVGKTGVEEYYNKDLSGVPGNKVVQVDSAGTSYHLITYKDPLPGKDVELFVDLGLQNKAYQVLKKKVEDSEGSATGGAIVAQDPTNGSILAMVSYPAFDPNLLSSGISRAELDRLNQNPNFPFFNRVISAVYPPGSTFKLVTASAVLMEKIADKYTTIVDHGFIQVGSFIFKNWNTAGHGEVNMARALQVSNDTYFYIMGGGYGGVGGLGIEKLSRWAKLFGFGSKSGIDINGEAPGYMPDGTAREWYLGDDYISAIGQGDILSTPLQVNNMMVYFSNGGYLFKPRIVKNIDGKGDTEVEVLAQNLVDKENYDLIRLGAHRAVNSGGTAYPLYDFPQKTGIELAGKTGTSEYFGVDGKPMTHAWFTVSAPYYEDYEDQVKIHPIKDRPIVLTVFIEGGGGGSDDAAPLARELLDYWFGKAKSE